jgi:hypothetical protein
MPNIQFQKWDIYSTPNPPILPFQVNSDVTIVFPAPDLVYTDIYMVGVPYFFEELLLVQSRTSRHPKKPGVPMSTLGRGQITRPQPPPPLQPPASPRR